MATLGTLGRTTEIPNAAVGGAKSKTELEYLRPEAEGALTTQNVSLDDASMAQGDGQCDEAQDAHCAAPYPAARRFPVAGFQLPLSPGSQTGRYLESR